ncbi:hypothetical protein NDU88_003813 [Pleurodeles waltl]|uniref:Uncharacterized protein n=1 Tax=Pleurodeles waltl TaxID=8319 RepID=A0AAV7SH26_PLEWA|nr:hypothetical protein NDU88_003813 [Pleurodeles waltl]
MEPRCGSSRSACSTYDITVSSARRRVRSTALFAHNTRRPLDTWCSCHVKKNKRGASLDGEMLHLEQRPLIKWCSCRSGVRTATTNTIFRPQHTAKQ